MSSGERAMGTAEGKQPNTEALCQPPPPPRFGYRAQPYCLSSMKTVFLLNQRSGQHGTRDAFPPPHGE